jgi:hypothetical protein
MPPNTRVQLTTAAVMPTAGHPACRPRVRLMHIPLDGNDNSEDFRMLPGELRQPMGHMEWADAEIRDAVLTEPQAESDTSIRSLLGLVLMNALDWFEDPYSPTQQRS